MEHSISEMVTKQKDQDKKLESIAQDINKKSAEI